MSSNDRTTLGMHRYLAVTHPDIEIFPAFPHLRRRIPDPLPAPAHHIIPCIQRKIPPDSFRAQLGRIQKYKIREQLIPDCRIHFRHICASRRATAMFPASSRTSLDGVSIMNAQ